MTALEVSKIIEDFCPLNLQEDWDNSGFSIGDVDKKINKIFISLDCTPDVVREAIDAKADMIITHHPLIFKGVKSILSNKLHSQMIIDLIKSDIVVYSAHTNIDKVSKGVSGIIADKLKLTNREILKPTQDSKYGLGIVGDLNSQLSGIELLEFLKKEFSIQYLRSSNPDSLTVKRIAVCGGGCSSFIEDAILAGAQAYITADLSYHNFLTEKGFMVVDIGHYESEIAVVDLIESILRKKMTTFAILKSKNNNNPIHYI